MLGEGVSRVDEVVVHEYLHRLEGRSTGDGHSGLPDVRMESEALGALYRRGCAVGQSGTCAFRQSDEGGGIPDIGDLVLVYHAGDADGDLPQEGRPVADLQGASDVGEAVAVEDGLVGVVAAHQVVAAGVVRYDDGLGDRGSALRDDLPGAPYESEAAHGTASLHRDGPIVHQHRMAPGGVSLVGEGIAVAYDSSDDQFPADREVPAEGHRTVDVAAPGDLERLPSDIYS